MYTIVQTGGRQVRVTPGGVATLDGTAGEPGAELTLEQVLLVEKDGGEVLAGAPFVANARVLAVVDGEDARPEDPRLQEEAPQGHAPDQGSPRHLHAGAHQGNSSVRIRAQASWIAAMAHKKGQGSSRNGRDSNSQRLGVKAHDGNLVTGGTIIVRQRGRRFRPGLNAGLGKDDTIFAKVAGTRAVRESRRRGRVISILPVESELEFGHLVIGQVWRINHQLPMTDDQFYVRRRSRHSRRSGARRPRLSGVPPREVRPARRAERRRRRSRRLGLRRRQPAHQHPHQLPLPSRVRRPSAASTARARTAPATAAPTSSCRCRSARSSTRRRPIRRAAVRLLADLAEEGERVLVAQGRPRRHGQRAVRDVDQPRAAQSAAGRAGRREGPAPRAEAARRRRAGRLSERRQVDADRAHLRGAAEDRRLPVHDADAEPRRRAA